MEVFLSMRVFICGVINIDIYKLGIFCMNVNGYLFQYDVFYSYDGVVGWMVIIEILVDYCLVSLYVYYFYQFVLFVDNIMKVILVV